MRLVVYISTAIFLKGHAVSAAMSCTNSIRQANSKSIYDLVKGKTSQIPFEEYIYKLFFL